MFIRTNTNKVKRCFFWWVLSPGTCRNLSHFLVLHKLDQVSQHKYATGKIILTSVCLWLITRIVIIVG
jgi:hypothetical protein